MTEPTDADQEAAYALIYNHGPAIAEVGGYTPLMRAVAIALAEERDGVSDPRTSQFLPEDAMTVVELLKRVGGDPDAWSAEERRAVMRLAATRPQGEPDA